MASNRALGPPRAGTNSSPSSSTDKSVVPITQINPSGRITARGIITNQLPNQPPDQKTPNEQTRFIEAVRNGRDDEVQKLIDNPNRAIAIKDINDALRDASARGCARVVETLITRGAWVNGGPRMCRKHFNVSDIDKRIMREEAVACEDMICGKTALQAAAEGGYADIVPILLKAGAKVNAPPAEYYGKTALQAAAEGGHVDVVSILLEAGAEVNAPPEYNGRTALQAAAGGGHAEIVSILLKVGAGTELEHEGVAILMDAIKSIHIDAVSILLDAGVDINSRDKRGQTCLSWGIASPQLVWLLLTKGAKINLQALDGTASLHSAIKGLHVGSASILLDAGANTESEDYENRKPLDVALHDLDPSLESSNLVTLLLKHGCDIGRRRINSWRKMLRANKMDVVITTETPALPSTLSPLESIGAALLPLLSIATSEESVIFNVSPDSEHLITRKLFSIFEINSKTSVLLLKFKWNGKIMHGFLKPEVHLTRTGVEWQWFLLDGDFTPSSYGFSNVGNLTREVDKQALLSCYVSFEFLAPNLTTGGGNVSSSLGNAFQVQKRRSEISWTMRKPCIDTGQFDSSDPKPAPIFRTEDFRSTLDIGWILENGLDLFTLFVVDLHKKWRTLLEEVDSHLIREILLLKKGRTTSFIDNLLLDAQQWSNFRALLQTHVREARNVAKDFEERRYLCDEVEDTRAAVRKLQDTIERMEAEVRSEIKKFDEKTKEMIELEFNLVSIHEVRTSKTMGMSMKRLSWITFIFLPLMFVASLFGMNVDLVNGSTAHWWVVIALSIALFALVILGWALLKSVRVGEYFEDSDCTANPGRLEAFTESLKRIRRGQWSAVKGDLGADLELGRAEVSGTPEFKRPSRQWTYKLKEL